MLLQKVGRNGFKHGANSLSTKLFWVIRRPMLVAQTVSLRPGFSSLAVAKKSIGQRKLTVCSTNANLTIQGAKPYHVMFENDGFSCL